MHARILACLVSIAIPFAPGCLLEPDDAEPGEEERVELPPQPLPLPGSPTAYGMLRVVNELGFAALDREVGLDRQAAQSILAHRLGPDEYLGTADDRFVRDLEELDGLYWLGESNLWRIQSFALLEGWAPPEPSEACEPALAEAIGTCRRFATEVASERHAGEVAIDVGWGCVEGSDDDETVAAEFFARAGLPGYREPALGYHAMLCGEATEASAEPCALGVAGLADRMLGACSAAQP